MEMRFQLQDPTTLPRGRFLLMSTAYKDWWS